MSLFELVSKNGDKNKMLTLTEAAALIDSPETTLDRFEVQDSFNPGNSFGGHLCRHSDHRYGALVIDVVNGVEVSPQVIYCTPKLHYPFAKSDDGMERRYQWPKVIDQVRVYPKLDGTNICCFSYADAAGKRYVTFKTRLTPVVQSSKFGNFAGMWQELLDRYPALVELVHDPEVLAGKRTLSFEMYGYRNKILVCYEVALETRLLFTVTQEDGAAHPPDGVYAASPMALAPEAVLTTGEGLTAFYEKKRDEAEAINVKTMNGDVEEISGTEGFVFYVRSPEGWDLMKCKPASVEDLHWVGDFIPESRIIPTCWNALESAPGGILTPDYIKQLLLEEFNGRQVTSSFNRIEKAIEYVNAQVIWREKVRVAYQVTGLDFNRDGKAPVMRALASGGAFDKAAMKSVYSTLVSLGIAPPQENRR